LRRKWTKVAVVSVAAHHGIELAAGIGLPGEPLVGRRRAAFGWSALLSVHVAVSSFGGSRCDRSLATASGSLQALALQHYLSWPWQLRYGIPVLTDAEGLPARWLAVYNFALLAIIISTTIASASEYPDAGHRWHLSGLATLPAQHASARHHIAWLRDRGR
jgi:hypothetical protein